MVAGKSLLGWAADLALESLSKGLVGRAVVSTDDAEIAREAVRLGLEPPFLRPLSLAGDDSPIWKTVRHVLRQCGPDRWDAVLLLQPSSPGATVGDVAAAIDRLTPGHDCVISVRHVRSHPWQICSLGDQDRIRWLPETTESKTVSDPARAFVQRKYMPQFYERNGAIYLCRSYLPLMESRLVNEKARALVMPEERSIMIDWPDDLTIAEAKLRILTAGASRREAATVG